MKMQTSASFVDIRKKIKSCIRNSDIAIKVAVAWFTSQELLGLLVEQLDLGCDVQLIISDHIENQRLEFDLFLSKGGRIFVLATKSSRFLHDKFALFDNNKLIAGSYNWTNSAEFFNHEFVIQSEEEQLISQFQIRFEKLKNLSTSMNTLSFRSNTDLNSETNEDEFGELEKELENKFINTIKEANDLGAKLNTSYVIDFIHRFGGIGAANQLIMQGEDILHSGLLKLWEIKRLDLSFESIIREDKFQILFSNEVLDQANARLKKLNY